MPGNGAGIHCSCQVVLILFMFLKLVLWPEYVAQERCFPIFDFCLSNRSPENVVQEGSLLYRKMQFSGQIFGLFT